MLNFEKLSKHPKIFSRITGVEIGLFLELVSQIRPLREKRRDNFEKGGRNYSLFDLENHFPAMLIYYRCYITYTFLGLLFDSHETTVMRSVKRIERIAVKVIHIEKDRNLTPEKVEKLIFDVTEQPVQRPVKKQKKSYSGKKKDHTQKTQYTSGRDGKIHSVSKTYPGRKHDFSIYKDEKERDRFYGIPKLADSGYQGINKIDSNALIPFKKPKGGQLTPEQKEFNRNLSKKRIKVENVIREVKIFKIMSDTYRNRRKGHSIKANIIAGIVNAKTERRLLKQAA